MRADLLAHILNSVPQVIWSAGADGRPDFISDQWLSDYGGDPRDITGDGWIARVHPEDILETLEAWASALDRCEPYQAQFRLRLPDGRYRWALVCAKPELAPDGTALRWFGTCTDIHDRIAAQEALAEKQRLYRSVLEESADWIAIMDPDGKLQLVNTPGLKSMQLEHVADIAGASWSGLWPLETRETVEQSVKRAASGETVRFRGSCPSARGEEKWWDVVVTPIRDDSETVTKILAIARDSTVEVQRTQQLLWASEHDSLTCLPNRRAFQSRLESAVCDCLQSGGKVGLLLVDLDHFKHVNDTLGHTTGDQLLQELACRLEKSVRSGDFVARIGGDEFAIIVTGLSSTQDLVAVAEAANTALTSPLRLDGRSFSGGASIGGAVFPDQAETADDLFKLADTALYSLKNDGRGGTRMFHAHMLHEAQRVASQLALARAVINDQSVVPVYQAKVDLQSGEIVGHEALLRWRNGQDLELPETIEQAFKEHDPAAAIGRLMQENVFLQMRKWLDCDACFGRIALNAAPAEFLRDDYAERLLERLGSISIPPQLLELEVTEHALMERGSSYVERALWKLKELGVTIALDDFGTGCSSLSHLRDFPVDVVKIDRSFVQQMDDNPEIRAIVAAVVNLAASLEIELVAEGIESDTQVQLLRAMGCRIGQGYALGRPVSGDELTTARSAKAA